MSFEQFVNAVLVAALAELAARGGSALARATPNMLRLLATLDLDPTCCRLHARLQVSAELTFLLPTTIPARLVDVVASRGHSCRARTTSGEASMQAIDQTTFGEGLGNCFRRVSRRFLRCP